MKVLLIDDDADLLEMTARRLGKRGFEIIPATDLAGARAAFASNPGVPAVVCDLFLNHSENGVNYFEELEAKGYAGQFVLVTGDDTGDSRIEAYRKTKSNFSCLAKPYAMDELTAILQRAAAAGSTPPPPVPAPGK